MTKLMAAVILIFSFAAFAKSTSNLNKAGVAIDGYDPVSYFSGSPQKGDSHFQTKLEDETYFFASEANKQAFLKEPTKYRPQFGGWCAYAVADSKSKVEVDPKSYLIQDGKLLLFYNGIWGNTREKWSHTSKKDSKTYLQEAEANWPEVKLKDP